MFDDFEFMPRKSELYLQNEDIFYVQFNDVEFYIEDAGQENFYFCILKKLLPDIKLGKIFPLAGKRNMLYNATLNRSDKRKIYLLDKDYDDFSGKIIDEDNLFYLNRYSIENYLIDEEALFGVMVSEKPKINLEEIKSRIKVEYILNAIGEIYKSLVQVFIINDRHELGVKCVDKGALYYIKIDYPNLIEQDTCAYVVEQIFKEFWEKQRDVESMLKRELIAGINFKTIDDYLVNIPGKHLISILKKIVEVELQVACINTDSFCYRLAEKIEFDDLQYLRNKIIKYIKS